MQKHLLSLTAAVLALALGLGCASSLEKQILLVPYMQSGYVPTDADPMPARFRLFSEHLLLVLGITVTDLPVELNEELIGRSNPRTREIQINTTLTAAEKVFALAHEAAHILEPQGLSQPESETFSHAVAVETLKRMGMDVRHAARFHLAQYKQAVHVLRSYKSEINWAAAVLTGR
uniref:IrrE N-terminal-like domain-containing protein n=1 Tax=viral metagenome TaxID=1070528 RepID=A0A6M3LWF0_9ZZZZ